MIFEFTDGTTLEHHWYRNAKKESWTEENRKRASQYRRRHPVTRDDITCFTTKIRCEECGCNYRKQTCVMADGHQNAYWKCADKKNHPGKSLREDHLKEIINEVLGLDEFDEQVFLERIDHISVRDLDAPDLPLHRRQHSRTRLRIQRRKASRGQTSAGKNRLRPSGTASRRSAGRKSAKT
jgi:site-specific DNA recombinase